jgi:GntR family transcriptional regulator
MVSNFFIKYRKEQLKGLPKYVELREVLRRAILDGYWEIGEKLPPEKKIADVTPFSLGTVQKALKDLVSEGVVERKQGHGSFVSIKKIQMVDPWHFRFSSTLFKDFLKVYPKLISKEKVSESTSWAKELNPIDGSLIKIDRIISINNEFKIYSKFYLSASKYKGILSKSDKELTSKNFKTILHQEYNVSFSKVSNAIQIISLPDNICRQIDVEEGTVGILMEILASSKQKKLIYYQKVYIPPNKFKLNIADPSNIPDIWR